MSGKKSRRGKRLIYSAYLTNLNNGALQGMSSIDDKTNPSFRISSLYKLVIYQQNSMLT